MEDERVAAVVGRLQRRSAWKLPTFQILQDGQAVTPAPAPGPESSNGGAPAVQMTISVLESERGRELS